MEANGKCDKKQCGFTKGKLCQTNLISFCHKVTDLLEKGDLSNLDLSKALDSLLHREVLFKMEKMGILIVK